MPQDNYEIIVVDNGSEDKTAEVTKEYQLLVKHLKYIFDSNPGLHVGRHAGFKAAKGNILVYADDDIKAFPTWLEGISDSFEKPDVAMVGGNIFPEFETDPPEWVDNLWGITQWGKVLGYYSLLDFGNEIKEISPNYIWGCNFSIRKEVLSEIGGFHPDGMPNELIMFRGDGESFVSREVEKRGYKAIFNPKASIYHYVPTSRMNLDYLFRRSFAQGISSSYTQIRSWGKVKPICALLREVAFKLKQVLRKRPEPGATIIKGFWKGYLKHQKEARKNPELLKWILKQNYLEG